MTEHDDPDDERPISKRFDVELFIVHPTIDPAEISVALGFDAKSRIASETSVRLLRAPSYRAYIETRDGDIAFATRPAINGLRRELWI